MACEIEGVDGEREAVILSAEREAFRTAIIPAVLSAKGLMRDDSEPTGLLSPDALFTPDELITALADAGVKVLRQSQILVNARSLS